MWSELRTLLETRPQNEIERCDKTQVGRTPGTNMPSSGHVEGIRRDVEPKSTKNGTTKERAREFVRQAE